MRHPKDFDKVLAIGMTIIVSLSVSLSVIGYVVFGSQICPSVTLNLPPGDLLYQSARMLYAFVVVASFPLQFHVMFGILWPVIEEKFSPQKIFCELFTRATFVTLIFTMSIAIPNIGDIDSLVGAAANNTLQFIFPPIIQLMVFHSKAENSDHSELIEMRLKPKNNSRAECGDERSDTDAKAGLSIWTVTKDVVLMVFGLIAMATGVVAAIKNIIKHSENYSGTSVCSGGVLDTISSSESDITTSSMWTTFQNSFSNYSK